MPRPFPPEAPSFRRDAEISFIYPPFILISSSSPPSFILMKFSPQSDLQALKPVICGETGLHHTFLLLCDFDAGTPSFFSVMVSLTHSDSHQRRAHNLISH